MKKNKTYIQDTILNQARLQKIEVTIFTVNGIPIKGKVQSFDDYTVLILSDKNVQSLVYKSALSTIIPSRPIELKFPETEGVTQ